MGDEAGGETPMVKIETGGSCLRDQSSPLSKTFEAFGRGPRLSS